LSQRTGQKYRLPNGAEWECRAGADQNAVLVGMRSRHGSRAIHRLWQSVQAAGSAPGSLGQTALGSTTHQATLRNGSRIAGTTFIAYAPKDASPPTRSQLC